MDAVDERAHFPCVDEERVFASVVEASFGVGVFIFRQEPEANRDLRAVEELAGERDHAIYEVGFDEFLPDHRRSASRVDDEQTVVAWRDVAKRFRYPVWQFGEHGLMPGIRECLAELVRSGSDQWAIMRFFLAPSEQLGGRTPLALLRDGETAGAVALARSVAGD